MIKSLILASALMFANTGEVETPTEPPITEPTFEEKTYTLINKETDNSVSVVLKTKKDCVVITNEVSKNATYTIKESILNVKFNEKNYITFSILKNNELEVISYDLFVEKVYTYNEIIIKLISETECEIINGDTIVYGTYVLKKDKLSILTSETTNVYKIKEDETLEEIIKFDFVEWIKDFFTPAQVAQIMSWIAYIGTIIGLVANIKKLHKQKQLTAEDVKNAVMEEMGKKLNDEITSKVEPYLDSVVKITNNSNDIQKVLSKVIALSQQNTPESRLAILQCIEQLGIIEKETIEESSETIKEEVKTKEESKANATKELDKIIKDNGTMI